MSDWHSPFWQSLPTCPSIVVQHQRVASSLCCFPIITRSTVFMARKSSVCWQAAECPQVPGDTITYLRRRSVSNILEANRAELYSFYIFCPFSVCVQLMKPCGSVDALVLRVPAVPLSFLKGLLITLIVQSAELLLFKIVAINSSSPSPPLSLLPSLRGMDRNKLPRQHLTWFSHWPVH